MEIKSKNNAKGILEETLLDDGFYILKFQNETNDNQRIVRDVDSRYIQFHFCIKGNIQFNFNNVSYALPLSTEKSLLLYNPQRDLPMNLELKKDSWLISIR